MESLDFVMSFIETSQSYKTQFEAIWEEVLANFAVNPLLSGTRSYTTPYDNKRRSYGIQDQIILKDPETHKAVMTYVSKLAKVLFGDPNGEYISARPSGFEDAQGALTVAKLERYAFGLEGHYRTMVEGLTEMCCIGTSVVEVGYKYQEREVPVRSISTSYGMEFGSTERQMVPAWDDVCLRIVPVEDFFPDPSETRIEDMSGVAKRFEMTAMRAKALADIGIYDTAAVASAISNGGSSSKSREPGNNWRESVDTPTNRIAQSDFKKMIGYEYWGEVPWIGTEGAARRVITVLGGEVVRDRPFPFADYCLPFHSLIINPVTGRFYGLAPAEVIRFDQDFADALKMLLAEAVVRMVHPPIAFDPDRMESQDISLLKKWKADMPIAVAGGPSSIGTLQYSANVGAAFSMLESLKASMQGSSGAPGAIQGEGLGTKRFSASEASLTFASAMDQPELAALVIERECLPQIGKAILRRYQQFLDTDGLKRRVGEMPEPVWIGDIMGEFDIIFGGSRQAIPRQAKMQAFDRLVALSQSVPAFQMLLPTAELAKYVIGDLMQFPEGAAAVGSSESMQTNVLAMMMAGRGGQSGNGNGVATPGQPPGLPPAQAGGAPLGE